MSRKFRDAHTDWIKCTFTAPFPPPKSGKRGGALMAVISLCMLPPKEEVDALHIKLDFWDVDPAAIYLSRSPDVEAVFRLGETRPISW